MSRGPGTWQRALLNVTEGGLAMTIRAVVLDSVPQPARSDYVSARRATRALAEARRVQAAYVRACGECGAIRAEGGSACCQSVRPMLAVAPVGSRLRYLAPPPVRPVPSWICAAPPVHPLARYQVASVPGVLDVMIQRGLARVRSGEAKVGAADLIAALRLRQQIEAASQPDTGQWQDAVAELLDVARGHLGGEGFRDFLADVRNRPAFRAPEASR